MYLFSIAIFAVGVFATSATEFRVKVGDVLEKLKYPNGLEKIKDMGGDSVLKLAVDFDASKEKPKLVQFALIPKKKTLQPLTFGMEYKPASSKAILNIDFSKVKPGTVEAGEEYELKALLVGEKPVNWVLGNVRLPAQVSNVLPDIEDHFYPLPEIYTPSPQDNSHREKGSIVYLIASAMVLLPWIFMVNSWSMAGVSFKPSPDMYTTRLSVFAPLFSLSLMCFFALILASWVSLSIFTQLAAVAALLPPTAFFGFKTFKAAINAKAQQSKQAKTD